MERIWGAGLAITDEVQCLFNQLGGPGEMAEAMIAAAEGDITDLVQAGADCGQNIGLEPGSYP